MTKHVNRRIFLRGLGGAMVAAPFLGSLADRRANAQSAAPPKRLIAMFTHNGCITSRFFPAKSHGPLSAADLMSTTLAPLAPFADKLLIPRGMRAMNEWTVGMVRGQGNDPHTQVVGSYFTCQPITPNSNDPFSFNTATKFNAMPTGPSLDHVIAKQLSPEGTPLSCACGAAARSGLRARFPTPPPRRLFRAPAKCKLSASSRGSSSPARCLRTAIRRFAARASSTWSDTIWTRSNGST